MIGRENKKENDLFYTCSLIEYIARQTYNKRVDVVEALGKKKIEKIYELADIYHSDNIASVSDEFINQCHIQTGTFDNVSNAHYALPSYWDIGKVYKRLILGISEELNIPIIDALWEAYHSFVSDKINNYNSSFYYDAPQNILLAFLENKIDD